MDADERRPIEAAQQDPAKVATMRWGPAEAGPDA
jgi:hypothetical protein